VLRNTTEGKLSLLLNHSGLPVYGFFSFQPVSAPAYGQRAPILDRLLPPAPGHPSTPVEEAYQLKPGQSVRFTTDLAKIFDLKNAPAGKYRITFQTRTDTSPGGEVTLVDFRRTVTKTLAGVYRPVLQSSQAAKSEKASVRLSVVQAEGIKDQIAWLLVDDVEALGQAQSDLPSSAHEVRVGSEIEHAALDHRGQVWTVIKNGEERAMYLWTLSDLRWTVLVPPTKSGIEFGMTPAYDGGGADAGVAVIAGVEGEILHTTHSRNRNVEDESQPERR
jgi:hypothetical protein